MTQNPPVFVHQRAWLQVAARLFVPPMPLLRIAAHKSIKTHAFLQEKCWKNLSGFDLAIWIFYSLFTHLN